MNDFVMWPEVFVAARFGLMLMVVYLFDRFLRHAKWLLKEEHWLWKGVVTTALFTFTGLVFHLYSIKIWYE